MFSLLSRAYDFHLVFLWYLNKHDASCFLGRVFLDNDRSRTWHVSIVMLCRVDLIVEMYLVHNITDLGS